MEENRRREDRLGRIDWEEGEKDRLGRKRRVRGERRGEEKGKRRKEMERRIERKIDQKKEEYSIG